MTQQIAKGDRIRSKVDRDLYKKGDQGICTQIGMIECEEYLSVQMNSSGLGIGPILADSWELVEVSPLGRVSASAAEAAEQVEETRQRDEDSIREANYKLECKTKDPEPPRTPGAHWMEAGGEDPHGKIYDCERAMLALGKLTDDELANAAFMNYDVRPPLQDLISGKAHSPIVYMTAVKDRIRWLSRRLAETTALLEAERAKQSVSVEDIQSEIETGMAANQQKQSEVDPDPRNWTD